MNDYQCVDETTTVLLLTNQTEWQTLTNEYKCVVDTTHVLLLFTGHNGKH